MCCSLAAVSDVPDKKGDRMLDRAPANRAAIGGNGAESLPGEAQVIRIVDKAHTMVEGALASRAVRCDGACQRIRAFDQYPCLP